MDPHPSADFRNDRRLTFTATHFTDYWAALSVRIRRDNFADLVFSGDHGLPVRSIDHLDEDPLGFYQQLSNRVNALNLEEHLHPRC